VEVVDRCLNTVNVVVLPQSSQATQQHHMAGEDRPPDLKRPPGFKWCYAHVTIAKQIQQHQQQSKVSHNAVIVFVSSIICDRI